MQTLGLRHIDEFNIILIENRIKCVARKRPFAHELIIRLQLFCEFGIVYKFVNPPAHAFHDPVIHGVSTREHFFHGQFWPTFSFQLCFHVAADFCPEIANQISVAGTEALHGATVEIVLPLSLPAWL